MDPSPDQIAALADQLSQIARDVAAAQDPVSKKHQVNALIMQAKKTIWAVQDPADAMMDQVVNGFSIGAILALIELKVFDAIPVQGAVTVEEIAKKTGAPEELIIRLMRQITCINICTEPALQSYAHNRMSLALSTHFGITGQSFFHAAHEEMLPSIIGLHKHLRNYGFHSLLKTYRYTPHSTHYGLPGYTFWEVLNTSPERLSSFMSNLAMWSAMHPVVAVFPFSSALQQGNSPSRVLAVDIGGGRGSAMLELRKNCPHLEGELILQDLPPVLDQIGEEDLPGVKKMVHDFFTPQPIQHAQMYYIRRVMHDWQDEDAVKILSNIVPAMAPDSRIIVSDTALPEPVTEIDAHAVWLDLMMLCIGGKERTARDWEVLGGMAGLKCLKVWQEPEKLGPICVVEYALPDQVAADGVNGTAAADGETAQIAVNGEKAVANGEAETGDTTLRMEPAADEAGVTTTSNTTSGSALTTNPRNLDGPADASDVRERDEDWEERTVVGDRQQSIEPSSGT